MTEEVSLYTIRHEQLPIIYIGISNDTKRRFQEHRNTCTNKLLKIYRDTLGSEAFRYLVICSDTRERMEELEELAILEARLSGRFIVCNILLGSVATGESCQKGESHWNARFTTDDIVNIRNIYALGGVTQKELGEVYGCSNKVISKITSGERWKSAQGSISKNMLSNIKANRRKLSDEQIRTVRMEALEEFTITGGVDISEISNIYGISRGNMRFILKGISYRNLGGPLLGIDYYKDYGK